MKPRGGPAEAPPRRPAPALARPDAGLKGAAPSAPHPRTPRPRPAAAPHLTTRPGQGIWNPGQPKGPRTQSLLGEKGRGEL